MVKGKNSNKNDVFADVFYYSRLFYHSLSKLLESSSWKELSYQNLFSTPNSFKIPKNPTFLEFFNQLYHVLSNGGKIPFFWNNFFDKSPTKFNTDENSGVVLNWKKKRIGSVYLHNYFYKYWFNVKNFQFFIILDNAGELFTADDRSRRQKLYYQLNDSQPFYFFPEEHTYIAILQLAPLKTQIKKSLRGSHLQLEINADIGKKWLDFIKKPEFSDLANEVGFENLKELIFHHINSFTKETVFSGYILSPDDMDIEQFYQVILKKIWEDYLYSSKPRKTEVLLDQISILKEVLNQKFFDYATANFRFLSALNQFIGEIFHKEPLILENNYCITLDLIPTSLYSEIVENKGQIEEWESLFPSLIISEPLTEEFLEEHPNFMVDTRHFSQLFKLHLLMCIPDFNSHLGGWVIHSDNRRALSLLEPFFSNKVDCVYTDPPYNTGGQEFTYQDVHNESDWLHLMDEVLDFFPKLGKNSLNFFISIDDNEYSALDICIKEKWGKDCLFGPIVIQINKGGRDYLPVAKTHEYIITGSLRGKKTQFFEIPSTPSGTTYSDVKGIYIVRELRNRNPKFNRSNRPNLYYPFYVNPQKQDENGFCAVSLEQSEKHSIEVFPRTSKNVDDCWRWSKSKAARHIDMENPNKSDVVARQKRNGGWNIYEKHRKQTSKAKTIWIEPEVRTEAGTIDIRQLFEKPKFDHPKPVAMIEKCLRIGSPKFGLIMDPFAGSGTTAQAVINLNSEDGGNRKFILLESSELCTNIILQRIKKVIFSNNWIEGIPHGMRTEKSSKIYQYFSLEQFNDIIVNTRYPFKDNITHAALYEKIKFPTSDSSNLSDNYSPWEYEIQVDSKKITFTPKFPILNQKSTNFCSFTYNHISNSPKVVDFLETCIWLLGVQVEQRKILSYDPIQYYLLSGNPNLKGKIGLNKPKILIIWRQVSESGEIADRKNLDEIILCETDKKPDNYTIFINFPNIIEETICLEEFIRNRWCFSVEFPT